MNRENGIALYFEAELEDRLKELRAEAYAPMLEEQVWQRLREIVQDKVRIHTDHFCQSLIADILKVENPVAAFDFDFITKAERERLTPEVTRRLKTGELRLPARLVERVEKVYDNAVAFFHRMFSDLYEHRSGICDLLFNGRTYTAIQDITGSGDTHNHGCYTSIITTDQGKLVYKPRSCGIDVAAWQFMKKYFDDIIVMPRAYAYEQQFGVIEYLEKKVAEDMEAAAAFYYALGGTTAVLKMLGSRDMHAENLFACDGRIALVDIETLLYPTFRSEKDLLLCIFGEKNKEELQQSVLGSGLFNQLMRHKDKVMDFSIMTSKDEMGSAPVIDGEKRDVLGFREKFRNGFSDIYDRCLEKRDAIRKDIEENFSGQVVRVILLSTKAYSDILTRLNSCYFYNSDEYAETQLEKLPKILKKHKQKHDPALVEQEIASLMENEVPFFYTYEGSRDIWSDGKLLVRDYFEESAIERAEKIILSLSEQEKKFEISLMDLLLDSTPVETKEEYPVLQRAGSRIAPEEAVEEAQGIMEEIYSRALRFTSGDRIWLSFDPGWDNSEIMRAGLYTGLSGVAVFFAAMTACAKDTEAGAHAKECLDSCLGMISRLLYSKDAEKILNDPYAFGAGEGGGLAGVLRSIVLIDRFCDGCLKELLGRARELIAKLDASAFEQTDKSSGLAGLIVTLCRYDAYSRYPEVQSKVYELAKRLVSLKTLPAGDTLLWKTLNDKRHPISGAVHGMTGIAEALLMAGRLLQTDDFAPAAADALTFEAESYCEPLGNWLDRRVPGAKKSAKGNCYGTEGIGIVYHHLKKQGIMTDGMPQMLGRAERAVRRFPPLMLDHLCCGNMSTVDYYLETGDRESAGRLLFDVVRRKNETGYYKLGLDGKVPNNNVTLFFGLAGIGYELIRYTDPEFYETVL